MMKIFPAAALAVALSISAHAQPAPAPVEAGLYRIEPDHTRVLFSVSHLGFTTYYGEFVGASGTMTLDPAHLGASHLNVSVPIGGVITPNAVLNGELKGPDWFDAARFPTMTFHSTTIAPTGPATADVSGDLTLHGVTRPVTLTVKFNRAGINPMDKVYTAGFEVSGQVKRSDFGVSKYVPMVGDDVHLIISAAFVRAPS